MDWPLLYLLSFGMIGLMFVAIVWDVVGGLVRSIVGETEDWREIGTELEHQPEDPSPGEGFAFREARSIDSARSGAAKGSLSTLHQRHRRPSEIRQRTFSNNQPNRSWKTRKPRIG